MVSDFRLAELVIQLWEAVCITDSATIGTVTDYLYTLSNGTNVNLAMQ